MNVTFFPKSLLALGLFLFLSCTLGQGTNQQNNLAKIESWGTRTFTFGNFTGTNQLNFFAGMTRSADGTTVEPFEFRLQSTHSSAPTRFERPGNFLPHALWSIPVTSGSMYDVYIEYKPQTSGDRILYVRMQAANGNIFNRGVLTLADTQAAAQNKDPQKANLVYGSVSAGRNLPIWAGVLGVLFWLSGYGIPVAAVLWGQVSGSSEGVFVISGDVPSLTLYYNMTGCTATQDYNNSFTVPVSQMQPGVAYTLDLYGWCGGGGIGNWAAAKQRAVLPGNLLAIDRSAYFRDPNVPGYELVGRVENRAIFGPDDCGGTYEDPLMPTNGILYKISGADCTSDTFGAPGESRSLYLSFPSLTLRDYIDQRMYPNVTNHSGAPHLRDAWSAYGAPRMNTGRERRETTFTPRAWVRGNLSSYPSSGTATGGGETRSGVGTAYRFNPWDASLNSAFYDLGWNISLRYSWTLKPYTKTCTVRNITSGPNQKSFTIYELTPAQTFIGEPGRVHYVSFPRHTLGIGGSLSLKAPGIYYSPELNSQGGITVSGCGITTQTSTFPTGYFVLY